MGTPMQMYNSSPMVNGSPHMYNSSPMTQPPTVSAPMAQHQQPPTLGMQQMSLGGGASSNPFDTQGPPAQKAPTNPFEF